MFRLFNPNHNSKTTIDLWRKPWYWQEPFPLVDYLLSQVCIPARGGTRTDWVSHYHCLLLLRTQNARLLALISTLFPLSLIMNLNVYLAQLIRTTDTNSEFLSAMSRARASRDLNFPCALSQNLDKFQFFLSIMLICT